MEKISAFVNEDGNIGTFLGAKYLDLYQKNSEWEKIDRINLDQANITSQKSMREYYAKLIKRLYDCKIVLVEKAIGAPYTIFYQEDFSVWELKGEPTQYFDEILEKEGIHVDEVNKEAEEIKKLITVKEPGYYIIDLEEIQNKKPDLSTKMVIRPFFAREDFNTLEVHCVHTPPWLEDEVLLGNILMNVEKYDEEKVVLYIKLRKRGR